MTEISQAQGSAEQLPPLVRPGRELSVAQRARFSRQTILPHLGEDGQRRLLAARVLVIGAGGLGSPVLLYLAAAGVGRIGIVEFDEVESSNLQRQIIHGESDVGRPKAVSAAESMRAVNAAVDVRLHTERLDVANAVALFSDYDLILDGTDNFATRYLVNDAAVLAHRPYVWGSIFRFEGQVAVFWEDAPDGRALNYRDLYPEPPAPGTVPSCAEGGVLGMLCGTIGSMMATEAVKLITGTGQPLLGRVLLYDALSATTRTIAVRKDPAAPPITALEADYDVACGIAGGGGADADVPAIDAASLAELLDSSTPPELIDVREPIEWNIARLPGATLVPVGDIRADGPDPLGLPHDRPVVLYCKTGIRSAEALRKLRSRGYRDVRHLDGGIVAWWTSVDPSLSRY